MKPKFYLWGLLLFMAITLVFVGWKIMAATEKNLVGAEIGSTAPDFTLTDINGKSVNLKDVVGENKATLVNFWATWCPPCRSEIPELNKFYQKYGSQKVALLAVDIQEDPSKVKSFVKGYGMNFPVVIDATGKVANQYRVSGIPTTFILDNKGKVRDMIVGGTTLGVLESKIKPLLKDK